LTNILNEAVGNGPFHFDFFSLDVEGAEFEVVTSLDFGQYSFGVIFVESEQAGGQNVVKNLAIRTLLEENGYIFLEERSRSYWFLHPKWHKIYANVTEDIFG
jgi:hypothetical protein